MRIVWYSKRDEGCVQIIIIDLENGLTVLFEEALLVLLEDKFVSEEFPIVKFCNHFINLLLSESLFEFAKVLQEQAHVLLLL